MVTLSGAVRVCVDGEWRLCEEGQACLLPAHRENAYEVEPGQHWEHAWICLLEPPGQAPTARLVRPLLAPWPVVTIRHAILGLLESAMEGQSPALQAAWVDVLHAQVEHFAGVGRVPDAFVSLWDRVSERLNEAWTLERLAGEAHCSREQLRRLCQREFGRSPHNQVIQLRLRRAARLLSSTDAKVESVAEAVGYSNAFVFSLAFKKGTGFSPTEYRSRGVGRVGTPASCTWARGWLPRSGGIQERKPMTSLLHPAYGPGQSAHFQDCHTNAKILLYHL